MVSTIAAWRRLVAASALALLTVSCAELPVGVERPVTGALATPDGTPLAALVQQRRQAVGNRIAAGNASGFLLMPRPELAYASRLALIEGATRTLDLQYYAVHADSSTTRLTDGLRAAAARGVRVRVLIDDFHSTGRDAQVLALALVPGIDIRLFNPLPGGRTSTLARALGSIDDASRIQQRMHNKLFIADNVLGVTGGRNLGDAYFGNDKKGNFVDLDVLAAGPIVQDMSRSFDRYWNNERAYPVPSLVPRAELESLRDDAARDAEAARKSAADTPAPDAAAEPQPLDLKQAGFVWAPAVLLADKPAKIAADTPGASSEPGLVVTRPTALGAASEAAAEGDTVVEGLLQLVGQAQRELLIISPYFVPGPDMKRAFAALTARGVRVRVLTNSLASNDAPVAHVGYARHREELLAMGVQLYEMRGEGASLRNALGRSGSGGSTGDSRAMLHSKVLVMDRRLLVVGSMNLDLRSQLQNTEVALLIRNGELSGAASDVIETTLREAAWHVERVDGQLTWRAPEGSGLKDTTTEPDASATLKLVLKLLGPLAPDSML